MRIDNEERKDKEIKVGDHLSDDIIVDNILSRISAGFVWESLRQSRQWSSMIMNPYFAKTNLKKSDSEEGIFCMARYRDEDDNMVFSMKLYQYSGAEGFTPKTLYTTKTDVHIISSCKGLFLAQTDYPYPPFIINPLTGDKGRLPPPLRQGWSWQQLMFIPSKSEFISVRMCYNEDETLPLVLEISSTVVDGGTKIIEIPKPYSSEDVIQTAGSQVAMDGIAYFNTNKRYILSFDVCSEKYLHIIWPSDCTDGITNLVKIGGFLSLAVFNKEDISNVFVDIWMLKDPIKQVWSRIDRLGCGRFDVIVGGLNNGDVIVFRTSFWELAAYHVKTKQWRVMGYDTNKNIRDDYGHQIHADSLYPVCCS